MHTKRVAAGLAIAAALLAGGCNELDVTNPNAPDAPRALTNPTAITAIAGGTLRSFFNAYNDLDGVGALVTQARSHTASWNNYNMNFYSSIDNDGTRNTRGWQNSPTSSARTSIEHFWQAYYSIASASVDVLYAIRVNNIEFPSASDSARAEAMAELMLGASLGQIALNYDKGYFIDETVDLLTLQYIDRKALRDSAIVKLQSAIAIANANTFTLRSSWTNTPVTTVYSNVTVSQLANTLAAMTLAYWPRTDAENGSVDWAAVAAFAQNGLQNDLVFIGDGCASFCPELQSWSNDIFGIRVHTRVSNLLDAATQATPYPDGGNPQPNSADARLGDGSFGDLAMEPDYGTIATTANAGTDFAYSSYEAFFATRGQYHQSNIGHIRYDASGTQSTASIYSGYGPVPLIPKAQNDLLWAEALIRGGGSLATAATLINNTRVTRGGLSATAAGDGAVVLLQRLEYETEIELLSLGASVFYNRRRFPNGLIVGTPREMPVPARELGVKLEALYTWGGAAAANSPTPP